MTIPLPVPLVESFPDVQQNLDALAMQFPIAAQNLLDKAATARKTKLDVVTQTATGNNGYVIDTTLGWSNLFWVDYTTPNVTMQGIVLYATRLDDQVAGWHWSRSRISPVVGSTPVAITPWALLNTYGTAGNPVYAQHIGWAYFQLLASTTYQFAVQAQSSAANIHRFWPTGPETHAMTGIFWAL